MSFIGFDVVFVMNGCGEGLVQTLASARLEHLCLMKSSSSCDECYRV